MSRRDAPGSFLYGVDLEDVRTMIPDGSRYEDRVAINAARFLEFFDARGLRITFFTVGNVARSHPDLIRTIHEHGHEIACHTSEHVPLTRQTPDTFREDLERCRDDLARAGAHDVVGFRAPILSLVPSTDWAYEVMAGTGFSYSSSVLPGRSTMFGWPDFGQGARKMAPGVWEIPVSVVGAGFSLAFAGGLYLRILPGWLVTRLARSTLARGRALVGYGHPYDVDPEQERFMHAEIGESRLLNWLMYRNRDQVFPRLDAIIAQGAQVRRYRDFAGDLADA